jgi:hypothetical protein
MRIGRATMAGVATFALVAGFGIANVSAAGSPGPARATVGNVVALAAPSPYFVSSNLALKKTYITRGSNAKHTTATVWENVDGRVTIGCPGKTGSCIVAADMTVQFQADGADATVNLCPYVDGSATATDLTCGVIVGWAPDAFGWNMYHFVHTFKILHGSHTVRTFINASSDGDIAWFSNTYSVYRKM